VVQWSEPAQQNPAVHACHLDALSTCLRASKPYVFIQYVPELHEQQLLRIFKAEHLGLTEHFGPSLQSESSQICCEPQNTAGCTA
jgi:hypothetical protein